MKQFLILLFCLSLSIDVHSQELDDMYFTGSDRSSKNKLKNKVTPADIILSKFREGNTAINSAGTVDVDILNRYKSDNPNKINYSQLQNKSESLKFNRDNLYVSSDISNSLTNPNFYSSFIPHFYTFNDPLNVIDPYSSMYYNMTSYDMMFPRNINGLGGIIATSNPMLLFSNPYLVSFDPRFSPALLNLHYPSFNGFGLGCSSLYKHGTWMFTNNGTGGGAGHTLTNRHMYVSGFLSKSEKVGTRGPRSGRFTSMNGENINKANFTSRRQSGITNQNISEGLREGRGQIFGNVSQNTLFRDQSQERDNMRTSSRSNRSSSLNSQNRRSFNNARSSSEKINSIMEFSNTMRSSYSGSTRGYSNYTSEDGRRSGYSAPPVSFNPARGRMSSSSRSVGFSGTSNSGGSSSYSSGGSGSSYSSGGSSGGGVVSGGSSGGSSRGGGRN